MYFNAVQIGMIGQGGGLFQYLSKIYYDRMINCEQWKDKICVILCIIKRNYASVMLYPCILSVALLMHLIVFYVACLTVFVNCLVKQFKICLVKQFAICLSVVVILLLNVMEVFRVGGGALMDRPCMVFQRICKLCL